MDLDGSSPPSRPHKSVLVTRLCGSYSGFRFHVLIWYLLDSYFQDFDFQICEGSASVLWIMATS